MSKLDEIYQERANAIMAGAACLEAFINGLGYDTYKSLWVKGIEDKLSVDAKWVLFFALKGKGNVYDVGRQPHQTLVKLVRSRNALLHYKRRFTRVTRNGKRVITDLESALPRDFIRELPDMVRELILNLCSVTQTQEPPWLYIQPGWSI
ncbi:MAG: hypothetical protein ACYCX4_09995 [Bacillota bacterium]